MIIAFMDLSTGALCVLCRLRKYPEIATNPLGDHSSIWFPLEETTERMLSSLRGELCFGEGSPHKILNGISIAVWYEVLKEGRSITAFSTERQAQVLADEAPDKLQVRPFVRLVGGPT